MSETRLVLKQSTGWFAAGGQFLEALVQFSDAAFKLYVWLCLHADRHTGRMQSDPVAGGAALQQPASWVEPALQELLERGVCRWTKAGELEVADRYWPYERQSSRDESRDYVGEVRRMLLSPACVRCSFTPADERLSRDLDQRGISLQQLQRAIWLGCARKYMAMLNGQPQMPISSLRYFIGLVEEVQQVEASESYWQHVRSKANQLERQWLKRDGCSLAAPRRANGAPFRWTGGTGTAPHITGMADHFTGINDFRLDN